MYQQRTYYLIRYYINNELCEELFREKWKADATMAEFNKIEFNKKHRASLFELIIKPDKNNE